MSDSATQTQQLDLAAAPAMDPALLELALHTNGFMPEDEGLALNAIANIGAQLGPIVEIGTWCGKSTLYLADAARRHGQQVITIDHHRGSEENQEGWEHHDTSLIDPEFGKLDTLPYARKTFARAGVEDTVIVVVGQSPTVAQLTGITPGMVFIDGGHSEEMAQGDYEAWAPTIPLGGLLVVHDVFPDPKDGGQPPWHVVQRALGSAAFAQCAEVGSLRALVRVAPGL